MGPADDPFPFGIHLSIHTEVVPAGGEDAEPLLVFDTGASCCHLAVFDGMGGSGARAYGSAGNQTGAYIASRLARNVLEVLLRQERLCSIPEPGGAAELVAARLREAFERHARRLDEAEAVIDQLPGEGHSRLVSKMIRVLPTTLAAACVTAAEDGLTVSALWAGDSRVYVLTPGEGLQQVTSDHLRYSGDAFSNLYDDSPLANFVSADQPFRVEASVHRFRWPLLVIAATDGCFGYWPSPMHFEEALLDSMCRARTIAGWCEDLEVRVRRVTADDASLVAVAPGAHSFRELAGAFRERLARLRAEFLPPPDQVDLLRELWARYRRSYESRLWPGAEAT